MVSAATAAIDPRDKTIAAALGEVELIMGRAQADERTGQLVPFGAYWFWSRTYLPGETRPRLFEWTPAGIADMTTERQSLHAVKAGAWHRLEGLFDYWLQSDADHVWFQVPVGEQAYYVLVAGGQSGVNRKHSLRWHCRECGTQLGEEVRLRHNGSPEDFLRSQGEAVAAFNAGEARRRCASCDAVHPGSHGFQADPGPVGDTTRVQAALGNLGARRAEWNAPAARLSELEDGKPLVIRIGVRQIALVRQGEEVLAINATCPHYGGPLALGDVRHGEIVCPWHRFRFDLGSGCSKTNPGLCAPVYDVAVRGDEVILTSVRG